MSSNDKMIHGQSGYQPNYFPLEGPVSKVQIDRAQSLDPTFTRNREKVEELGREGTVEYVKLTPSGGVALAQKEYGSIEFFNALANIALDSESVELTDFKSATGDFASYLTNDDGVFIGTIWMSDYRLNGFSITLGDPQGSIDRSFDMVGEKCWLLEENNKYVIPFLETVKTGEEGDFSMTFGETGTLANYPTPVLNPNVINQYMLTLIKISDGVSEKLTITEDYEYDEGTNTLVIFNCLVGDIVKGVYSASTYITGEEPFVPNDVDRGALLCNGASIYLNYADYIYKLQSVTIDVSFDRQDNYEIGNKDVVQRGINDKTVTITLGKLQDAYSLESKLSGQSGIIDFEDMSDDATLTVEMHNDYTKELFKIGLKAPNLSVSEVKPGSASLNTYLEGGETLEGDELLITVNKDLLSS